MTSNIRIDLSSLPFPEVVKPIDFEIELQSLKAELLDKDADLAEVLNLESEPLVKLLEIVAYRYMLKTNHVNEAAKSLMLAYATGATLDHIGAGRDVYRLTVKAGNPNAIPPIEDILESDEAFRRRIQLQPESKSAGSRGAYEFWSLSSHGDVRDVAIITASPGHVEIWIQSHSLAIAPQSLLDAVLIGLNQDTRCPTTDFITIHAATPFNFQINSEITLLPGPDSSVVVAAADQSLDKYIDLVSHLGYDVNQSALYAALHQSGVQRVALLAPTENIILPPNQYAHCTSRVINIVEYRDV